MGFLVPPWWRGVPAPAWVREVVSTIFGFFLASAVFAGLTAARQTFWCLKRRKGKMTAYIIMVITCWSAGVTLSSLNYASVRQALQPSFWLYFFAVLVRYSQILTLMLILTNRVSLIMYSPANARRLKIAVVIIITLLNIGLMVIWVPTRLQINDEFKRAMNIFDRIEKSLFLVVDGGLNILFIYLVRTKLVATGLTQYRHLYRFNIMMVTVSISLDVVVIGLLALDYPEMQVPMPREAPALLTICPRYIQFRAMAAMLKLHIEMTIADFIAKIIKSSHRNDYAWDLGNINDCEADAGAATSTTSHTTAQLVPTTDCRERGDHLSAPGAARVSTHPAPSLEGMADLEGNQQK